MDAAGLWLQEAQSEARVTVSWVLRSWLELAGKVPRTWQFVGGKGPKNLQLNFICTWDKCHGPGFLSSEEKPALGCLLRSWRCFYSNNEKTKGARLPRHRRFGFLFVCGVFCFSVLRVEPRALQMLRSIQPLCCIPAHLQLCQALAWWCGLWKPVDEAISQKQRNAVFNEVLSCDWLVLFYLYHFEMRGGECF